MATITQEGTKKIGETLKEKRRELNLSLKEAENATSIRMSHLKALEEGDISQLISPVYAQGFMRQYATFLGFDGDAIVRESPELFAPIARQEFSYGIGTMEVRGNPGAGVKWFPNALWIGVFTAIVVMAWAFAKYLEVV
ncbi:MAG: helix-turn-helix domain-containing protein [Chlamydiales bacterium]|nr:helix-turn-helix domain-containing protein [Chlamydiales bacterium]